MEGEICYVITATSEYGENIYFYMRKTKNGRKYGWTKFKQRAYHFKTKESAFKFGKQYFVKFKNWAVTTYKKDVEEYLSFVLSDNFYTQYNTLYNEF